MPYLNWKEATLTQEITPQAANPEHMRVTLTLTPDQLQTLLSVLEGIFAPGSLSELRLDLPKNWIIFWKQRDYESRLLLAHPQAEEWVTTVALMHEHALPLLARLNELAKAGRANTEINLSQIVDVGSVSNAELQIRLA